MTTTGDTAMIATTPTRTHRRWRKRWVFAYQDASGTPDGPILEAAFKTEAAAMAWADTRFVVPLWLDEQDQLLGDNACIIGTIHERHEI